MVHAPENDATEHLVYRLEVSSALGLLEQQVDCRIFQDKDVKEIVSGVLRELGIADNQQSWRLAITYPKREYCVQYNESALAFVSRLLEEEGIFFFSDKGDAGELLVFEDENHWVLKPANSIFWYHNVLDWLDEWVKPDHAGYEKHFQASSLDR